MPPCYLQKYIIECSIKSKVPCIFGGVGINEGSYGPLLDNKKSKINELKKINSILEKINYYFPCKSSFGITNSLVSNFMAWDIIMYLMNEKKLVRSLNEVINNIVLLESNLNDLFLKKLLANNSFLSYLVLYDSEIYLFASIIILFLYNFKNKSFEMFSFSKIVYLLQILDNDL